MGRRPRLVFLVLLGSLLAGAPLRAQGDEDDSEDDEKSGEHLYISRGCLGCHGASGRGGVGPVLAGTRLPFEAFLHQLREPRDIMPTFPDEIVSEDDAEEIHDYLRALTPDVPKLRADLPRGVLDRETCAECHRGLHPTIVEQFETSAQLTVELGLSTQKTAMPPWKRASPIGMSVVPPLVSATS